MKGQSSLELLVTVGVVIAFTLPVLFMLLSISSVGYEKTAMAQADASSRSLAEAMNFVYAQGPGAKKVLLLNTPASTQEVYASNGEAVVRIKTTGGTFEAASPTFAKIQAGTQGTATKTGLFTVIVSNVDGEVKLSEPS